MCRSRRFVRVSRVAPDIDIAPFDHNFSNLVRAVKERVFKVKGGDESKYEFVDPPRPEPGVFSGRLSQTYRELLSLLPKTAPVSHDDFVESYKGRKKEDYARALNEMRSSSYKLKDEAKVDVFIKFEKTDFTNKTDPVPRVISPRSKIYNIKLGRYIKHLEKRLFRSLGRLFGHPTVIKGYNATQSATLLREKWDMFKEPVAIGLDASRFDQHVSKDALEWEHKIYLACFPRLKHRERLARILDLQINNHCVGYAKDGRVTYSIEGTRMSGDMNTSMGNCILMTSMVHAYVTQLGIKTQLANNGDDCVVFMEKTDLAKFSKNLNQWFLELGFNLVVEEPATDFEALEFCQTKPVFDGHEWIMVRNPLTAIAKDSVMLQPWQGESLYRGWLDAVGSGGLALTGGIPIFQNLYRMFVKFGKYRPIPQSLLSYSVKTLGSGISRVFSPVTPICRASFYTAFGITPDEQLLLEDYYDKLDLKSEVGIDYHCRSIFL